MMAAVDVHYEEQAACAGLVAFPNWEDPEPVSAIRHCVAKGSDYVSGEFFRRELPVILAALEQYDHNLELVLVDGYVDLDWTGAPGLGRHLYEHLARTKIVVGVAKSRFRDTDHAVEVLRGGSSRPLFVTAAGMPAAEAAKRIQEMHGPFRIPSLLKLADAMARGNR